MVSSASLGTTGMNSAVAVVRSLSVAVDADGSGVNVATSREQPINISPIKTKIVVSTERRGKVFCMDKLG